MLIFNLKSDSKSKSEFTTQGNIGRKKSTPSESSSRMRSDGSWPKAKPWNFLFSLSLLISFTSTSFGEGCTSDPEISYVVKDEFGVETSIPRVGGILEITCTKYGSDEPILTGASGVKHKDGKFVISIKFPQEFRCTCDKGRNFRSNKLIVTKVLCSPQGAVCPESNELCWLQANGTRKCGRSQEKICVDGKKTPPVTSPPSFILIETKAAMVDKLSCEALQEENNEKWGQVELKKTTSSILSVISKGPCTYY